MIKTCVSCDQPIVGRPDKRFCSDACRYEFHNHNRMEGQSQTALVIKSMRSNRILLRNLMERGIVQMSRRELEFIGFNFWAVTGAEWIEAQKKLVRYCFEYRLEEHGGIVQLTINSVVPH